ncbi:MAG: DUF6973 domain-containing protein [Bacteroidia bacterium]
MRAAVLIFLIFTCSCSSFSKLSKYEKRWAMAHPFAALKVKKLSKSIFEVYQQMKNSGQPDRYENGGKLDAFRHTFAMAVLSTRLSSAKIRKLGEAHEKGNYLDFIKGRAEEGELPDSIGTLMDLKNNDVGISIGKALRGKKVSLTEIRNEVLNSIAGGNAFYIKRSISGAYLDCYNRPIDMDKFRSRWAIPKCLISTKE